MKNVFTKILEDAEAERQRRHVENRKTRERIYALRPRITPGEDEPIPWQHREYLRRKVKEMLYD
jgi:hypothetical protein